MLSCEAMDKLTLRLRRLEDGEGEVIEHDDVEAAMAWLRARPPMIEVLGVVFEGLSKEDNARMKGAMRPLDDAEKARIAELDAAEAKKRMERDMLRRAEAETQSAAAKAAAKNADPARPMELRYRYDWTDLQHADVNDERPITDEARAAVMAWVHERMEWVADRGQTIGEAKVMVYPGVVPAKKDRVVSGSFVPISAPEKGTN